MTTSPTGSVKQPMRIFSTFTGIGGFEIGIQNAYRETLRRKQADTTSDDEAREGLVATKGEDISSTGRSFSAGDNYLADERPLFVGYSEIDKYAESVYQYNFPGRKNYGDIREIKAAELPDFDVLVGGFPCQAFSVAGKRRGFADTRGTLFFDLARILKEKQPRLFVFENVKGLLSHDEGRTFTTIIATIDELGYDCQWQVLNSKDFGVPQNRERVIIVGHLRGTPRPEVFPIGESNNSPTWNGEQGAGLQRREISNAIDASYFKGHDGKRQLIDTGAKIRRLTPLECERLQAFPDDWTKYGVGDEPISDTQRYKMCGNAVTTNVIQAVFERIFSSDSTNRT